MRTFTYLGPNNIQLLVVMNGMHLTDNSTLLTTWYFRDNKSLNPLPDGFNSDREGPSPVLEGIEGQNVNIELVSGPPHTIHLHGLDVPQAVDGVASTSGFVGNSPGSDFGHVSGEASLGSPFNYTFTAPQAGTYMYHCHIDTVLHMHRAMFGTVIIRPPSGSITEGWAGGPTFTKEYVWQLHSYEQSWFDESLSLAGLQASGAHFARPKPDFFCINGYDGGLLNTDSATALSGSFSDVLYLRLSNVGYQLARVSLGGLIFHVVASDGRPLVDWNTSPWITDEILVAPGERYDLRFVIPPATDTTALVEYFDMRNSATPLGMATTTIKSV